MSEGKTSSRLAEMTQMANGINAVRALAAVLVVLFHAAVPYLTSPIPTWILLDTAQHVSVDLLIIGINGFVMPLFFLLAGMSLAKSAAQTPFLEFARHRISRLGATILLAVAVVFPPLMICWGLGLLWTERMTMAHLVRMKPPSELNAFLGPGHFWFLEYLLLLSLGWSAVVRLAQRWSLTARLVQGDWSHAILGSVWGPLVFAIPTAIVFAFDLETPFRLIVPFTPDLARLAYFLVFLMAGVWLTRLPQALAKLQAHAPWYLLIALLAFGGLSPLTLAYFDKSLGLSGRWALCGLQAIFAWSMVFGFIGLMLRWCSQRWDVIRYLNEASFWIYLVHLVFVCGMQLIVWPWPLSPWLKLLIVATTAVVGSLLSYEYCVRYSWLGSVFNGSRKEHPTARGWRLEAGWLSVAACGLLLCAAFLGMGWNAMFGTNLHPVVAGRIYRSNRLQGEELTEIIRRHEIRSVVSLAPGFAQERWFQSQQEVCDQHQVPLAAFSFAEFAVPAAADLQQLQIALQQLPKPVLIIGGNRSPTLSGFGAAVALLVDEGSDARSLDDAAGQLGLRYFQLEGPEHCIVAQPLREYRTWLTAEGAQHSAANFRHWTEYQQTLHGDLMAVKANQPKWQAMMGAPRYPRRF